MTAPLQFAVRQHGYHPGLGTTAPTSGASPFSTTSGTASFAVGEAGALTAASLALVGLGPVGAIVAAGTQLVAMVVSMFHGCGQTCTLTSEASNQIESQIANLMAAYFASPRTKSDQTAALQAFDQMWAQLEQYCGQGSMGQAGQNCIADRQAGACKWKSSPPSFNGCSFVGSGPAGSGTWCFNWFSGYRDPIANDPCVVPDPASTTSTQMTQALSALGSAVSSSLSSTSIAPLILAGAAILALLIL